MPKLTFNGIDVVDVATDLKSIGYTIEYKVSWPEDSDRNSHDSRSAKHVEQLLNNNTITLKDVEVLFPCFEVKVVATKPSPNNESDGNTSAAQDYYKSILDSWYNSPEYKAYEKGLHPLNPHNRRATLMRIYPYGK